MRVAGLVSFGTGSVIGASDLVIGFSNYGDALRNGKFIHNLTGSSYSFKYYGNGKGNFTQSIIRQSKLNTQAVGSVANGLRYVSNLALVASLGVSVYDFAMGEIGPTTLALDFLMARASTAGPYGFIAATIYGGTRAIGVKYDPLRFPVGTFDKSRISTEVKIDNTYVHGRQYFKKNNR